MSTLPQRKQFDIDDNEDDDNDVLIVLTYCLRFNCDQYLVKIDYWESMCMYSFNIYAVLTHVLMIRLQHLLHMNIKLFSLFREVTAVTTAYELVLMN